MITRGWFQFDGVLSSDLGIWTSGAEVWNGPARKGESVSVPGRNGDIWIDGGAWENVMITYPCWISDGFDQKIDLVRAWLEEGSSEHHTLTDSYHPDEARTARFVGPLICEPGASNATGRFDITFDCDPRRMLTGYEMGTIVNVPAGQTVEETFDNPTRFTAFPNLYIASLKQGSITFTTRQATTDVERGKIEKGTDGEITSTFIDLETLAATAGSKQPVYLPDVTITGEPHLFSGATKLVFDNTASDKRATFRIFPRYYRI